MKNQNQLSTRINQTGIRVITVPWGVIAIYLLLLSWFSTTISSFRNTSAPPAAPKWEGWTYYLPDKPWQHILALILFTGFLILVKKLYKRYRLKKAVSKILKPAIICSVYFGFAVIIILLTRLYPKSDPADVARAAQEILSGDFHQFNPGEYLHRFPFQSGIIYYISAMILLFKDKYYIAMQVINAALFAAALYYFNKIIKIIWHPEDKAAIGLHILALVAFIPISGEVTMTYGNIAGLTCFMIAIYHELSFFNDRKYYHIIIASLLAPLGCVLKGNYMVLLIGMLVFLGIDLLLTHKKLLTLLFAGALIFFHLLEGWLIETTLESYMGFSLPPGYPKSAWIMEGVTGSGSYSEKSSQIFQANQYDYNATDEEMRAVIKKQMQIYMADWRKGLDFFGRKQANSWNEPTFSLFAITRGREGTENMPAVIQSLINGRGSIYLTEILNFAHSILLFGICIYIFLCRKTSMYELIFALIFMGEFVLQIFWEAVITHTTVYLWLLIPYAVRGYKEWLNRLHILWANMVNGTCREYLKRLSSGKVLVSGIIVIGALAVIIPAAHHFTDMKTFKYVWGIRSEETELTDYDQVISYILKSGKTYDEMFKGE